MKTDFDLIFEKVGSTEELIENISELSSDSETILTTYVNPYSVQLLRRNVIHKLSNIYVDGITLVWLLKFAYGFKIRRASFDLTSHAEELFSFCETTSYKFGMIGGTESEIESSVKFFSNRYPGLKINFFCSGYLDETNNQNLFNNLEGCDFIICGMGTPKQEEFMISLKENFPKGKIIFSCGAFFSQTAQKGEYYHPLINKLNLRWVQRHFDSAEVRRRHLIEYPKFLYKFLKNFLSS